MRNARIWQFLRHSAPQEVRKQSMMKNEFCEENQCFELVLGCFSVY